GHGAQLSSGLAPVGHGRRPGVVFARGDERAAADYAAASGDGDPPGGATGARVCPVDAGHAVLPSCRKTLWGQSILKLRSHTSACENLRGNSNHRRESTMPDPAAA